MTWKYIITPLMGAVIGYITNWIAVKMLFRPRREIRVFGKKLPFTPGVIPRGQGRLARAVGTVVETQLLTPSYLEEKLLSEAARENFTKSLEEWKERNAEIQFSPEMEAPDEASACEEKAPGEASAQAGAEEAPDCAPFQAGAAGMSGGSPFQTDAAGMPGGKAGSAGRETFRSLALTVFSEEEWEAHVRYAESDVTDFLYQKILAANPGRLIVRKVMEEAKARLSRSLVGNLMGTSFLEKIGAQMEDWLDGYIADNARAYVEAEVIKASGSLQDKNTAELAVWMEERGLLEADLLWDIYQKLIREKLPSILNSLQLSAIVEDRINAMKVEEVETLVLSIMNKELGMIVNLGALIGFVLGIVNVLVLAI